MSLELKLKRTSQKNELEQLSQLIEFSGKIPIEERNRDLNMVRDAIFTLTKDNTVLSDAGIYKFQLLVKKYQ